MTISERSLRLELLDAHHDRETFVCGNGALDRYLREQAGQDSRRGLARIFVAVAVDQPALILGFFTLSATSVMRDDLSAEVAKGLPRYPIPAALIGRFAIHKDYARQGLGRALLGEAVRKIATASATVAIMVVVVDPIDAAARAFYRTLGFRDFRTIEGRTFLAMPRVELPRH